MNRIAQLFTLLVVVVVSIPLSAQKARSLQAIADEAVEENHTPGLILAVQSKKDGFEIVAAGRRKWDDEAPVSVDDKMHIGSCTKAFTGVLVARLVEQDKLRWDSTIAEVLPKVARKIHEDYRDITLTQLLTHTSGVPASAKNWWLQTGDNITKRRTNILIHTLKTKPEHPPEKEYVYSNFGYMIAGLMAAKAADVSWEEAVTTQVFEPLQITTAGFGVPGEKGKVTQPWGHHLRKDGKFAAIQGDNAPALGPAGTMHLSLSDWSKFVDVFLGKGPDGFLQPETISELLTPSDAHKYAKGWGVLKRGWGKGIVLNHAGSNTTWYANVWVAPNTGQAFYVAMNCASEEAMEQADELIGELILYLRTKQARHK